MGLTSNNHQSVHRTVNHRTIKHRAKFFSLLILWGSLASVGLTGCNEPGVRASQPQAEGGSASSSTEMSSATSSTSAEATSQTTNSQALGELQSRLPEDIPPTPIPPESTLLSKAATTADSDLLPASPQGDHQGPFRVGNQTQHPIRLALQTRLPPESEASVNPEGLDLEPVHWDFAPGEGGQSGLLMAVSQGDIAVRNGDVLVAFAQDGSRRYWGPYIAGETQLPYWDEKRQEWQLLIQP